MGGQGRERAQKINPKCTYNLICRQNIVPKLYHQNPLSDKNDLISVLPGTRNAKTPSPCRWWCWPAPEPGTCLCPRWPSSARPGVAVRLPAASCVRPVRRRWRPHRPRAALATRWPAITRPVVAGRPHDHRLRGRRRTTSRCSRSPA